MREELLLGTCWFSTFSSSPKRCSKLDFFNTARSENNLAKKSKLQIFPTKNGTFPKSWCGTVFVSFLISRIFLNANFFVFHFVAVDFLGNNLELTASLVNVLVHVKAQKGQKMAYYSGVQKEVSTLLCFRYIFLAYSV